MGARFQTQTVAINSNEVLSGTFSLDRGRAASITFPVVTSGHFILRGAVDATSASSRRLLGSSPQNSGEIRLYAGPGSCTVILPAEALGVAEVYRLESSVTQVNQPILTISVRL